MQKEDCELQKVFNVIESLESAKNITQLRERSVDFIPQFLGYGNCIFLGINKDHISFDAIHKGTYYRIGTKLNRKYGGHTNFKLDFEHTIIHKTRISKEIHYSKDPTDLIPKKLPGLTKAIINRLAKGKWYITVPCVYQKDLKAILIIDTEKEPTQEQLLTLKILGRLLAYRIQNMQEIDSQILNIAHVISPIIEKFSQADNIEEIAQHITDIVVNKMDNTSALFFDADERIVQCSFKQITPEQSIVMQNLKTKILEHDMHTLFQSETTIKTAIKQNKVITSDKFKQLLHPFRRDKIAKQLAEVFPKGNFAIIPLSRNKHAKTILIISSQNEITSLDKAIFKILGTQIGYAFENIRLINRIKKENEELLNILNNSLDAFFIYSTIGEKNRIKYVSPLLTKLTGYTEKEFLNLKDEFQMLAPELREPHAKAALLRENDPRDLVEADIILCTKTGKRIPASIRSIRIKFHGEPMYLLTIQDVSKEHRIYNELSKMYENQAELFSEIAHSLNTPFTVINGLIDLNMASFEKPKTKNLLSMIKKEVTTASRKINQLLQISRFDLQSYELDITPTDLREFLDAIYVKAKALGYKYCDQNHSTSCDCLKLACKDDIKIDLDTNAIMDVIMTIIENAYKYSPKKGTKPQITLSARKKKEWVEFIISDRGTGISPTELKTIFEPFSYKGKRMERHGIGLPMCKKVIDKHKGDIYVTSKLGEGTQFIFSLPIKNSDSTSSKN